MGELKRCSKCYLEQELTEFHKNSGNKDGLRGMCKTCSKQYTVNNKERISISVRKANLKRLYGITPEQYSKLSDSQEGKCYICLCKPRSKALAVDHDHKTKEVRGLLCLRCNKALGTFHDKAEVVQRALDYLTNPPARGIL